MSIPSLVLELWQFSLVRDWPEIWKSEIHPSQWNMPIWVLLKSGDCRKLRIPNLEELLLMLQNFTGFTVIKRKPTGGVKITHTSTQIRVKKLNIIKTKQIIFDVLSLYFSTQDLPKTNLRKTKFQHSIKDWVLSLDRKKRLKYPCFYFHATSCSWNKANIYLCFQVTIS